MSRTRNHNIFYLFFCENFTCFTLLLLLTTLFWCNFSNKYFVINRGLKFISFCLFFTVLLSIICISRLKFLGKAKLDLRKKKRFSKYPEGWSWLEPTRQNKEAAFKKYLKIVNSLFRNYIYTSSIYLSETKFFW